MKIGNGVKYDRCVREQAAAMFEEGWGQSSVARRLGVPVGVVRSWHLTYRAIGREGLLTMGTTHRTYDCATKLAAAREAVDGGVPWAEVMRRHGIVNAKTLGDWCRLYREGGAAALLPRPPGAPPARPAAPRGRRRREGAGARGARRPARGRGGVSKKSPCPEAGPDLSNREKALVVRELSGQGHRLGHLLEAAGLARSSYHYALKHPKRPCRPELRGKVAEVFGRTPNGCGHRQVAMALRAEEGVRVSDKTVLKIMNQMGLRCAIRRKGRGSYSSYKGEVGEVFENVIGRDFRADGPWQKMGTDVTEFKLSFGKAYLAPVYDFGSKEIVAFSISRRPDLLQQEELLEALEAALPEGARPIVHSDMGWQYQHATWVGRLRRLGATQSMSRKGNCLDNAATEQVFGHLKDEFYRGRDWEDYDSFERDLTAYIRYWNTGRRQVKLKGMTPVEFRERAMAATT